MWRLLCLSRFITAEDETLSKRKSPWRQLGSEDIRTFMPRSRIAVNISTVHVAGICCVISEDEHRDETKDDCSCCLWVWGKFKDCSCIYM